MIRNFLASLLIVLAAFAAGRYLFPAPAAAPAAPGLTEAAYRGPAPAAPGPATATTAPDSAARLRYTPTELHTIELFERAAPSVCYITTKALQRDFWTRSTREVESGSGSGFVWDQRGHIITNYHVIRGASSALITLGDGSEYEARVIGTAPEKDLAVLKISAPAADLQPIGRGDSYNIRVGQAVYAIGNPFGLDRTLTTGVVSALDREIMSQANVPIQGAIQTDAAINPGNSGGPLLDSDGRLIGVNTSIYSPSGASAGIGFSIPVDVVKYVVPDLIAYGEVRRASIGLEVRQYGRVRGLIVTVARPGGPGERAGIRGLSRDERGRYVLGDILVGINGNPVRTTTDLFLELEKYDPGEFVELNMVRDDRAVDVEIRLGSSVE